MSDDSTALSVRPYGYVRPTPVYRRLSGPHCLFLGNAAAATPACDRSFDHVLSVTVEPRPATTHHRPLTDDATNDWSAFAAAADTARRRSRRSGSVLVHCEAGISRSSAVAAAALAAEEHRSFVAAVHDVQDARPHAVVHPALHELGVRYVAANSSA